MLCFVTNNLKLTLVILRNFTQALSSFTLKTSLNAQTTSKFICKKRSVTRGTIYSLSGKDSFIKKRSRLSFHCLSNRFLICRQIVGTLLLLQLFFCLVRWRTWINCLLQVDIICMIFVGVSFKVSIFDAVDSLKF